jgi:RsmE family RNA methyltransferase
VNLILADPQELDESGVLTLSDARAAHLLDVLEVTPGRDVRVGLLDGPHGIGTVTSTGEGAVTLRCVFEQEIPARPRVDLLLALPRPKVMRRLWAQLAALGVGQIILTNAERVERHYFDAHTLQPAHSRPLLIEGLQQARDTRLPLVSIHRQFRILIEDDLDALAGDGLRLLADPSGATPITAAIGRRSPERLLLAVGPEGGWNDFERGLLQARGFELAGMGPRTLRSDTACVALLAIAHSAMAGPPTS